MPRHRSVRSLADCPLSGHTSFGLCRSNVRLSNNRAGDRRLSSVKETKLPTHPSPRLSAGALGETVGYRLRVAQIAAYRRFEAELGRYGSAARYLGLLAIIGTEPGQPQSRLAEAVSLKRSSLVAIIDRLAEEGLVERRHAPSDRRVNAVWLTERGRQIVAELAARAEQEEARMTAGLTQSERADLVRLLGRVVENLERPT